ncbi:hypothetical protein D9613_004733 [Agrocybe pediades]|uniref:Uncharacterized protein n=1 Tax=Agrocybe pediades TaxID=84607 RepID=A0A8H4QY63_9AGAR|nr:hypothetical protein D9613_004733 [Agrocybe pediades]
MPDTKKRKQSTGASSAKVYPIFAKKTKLDTSEPSDATPIDASAVADAFQQLLDFSQVTTENDAVERLGQVANTLIRSFRLVVKRDEPGTTDDRKGDGETGTGGDAEAVETEFEVLEAECYLLIGGGIHEDPFTHGSEEQKISGRWYFHRAPRFSKDSTRSLTSGTEYRDGTRKGLDLTLGGPPTSSAAEGRSRYFAASSEDSSIGTKTPSAGQGSSAAKLNNSLLCGGVLLRTIREVKTGKITSGPSLLVDRILAASGANGIKDLVDNKWHADISAFNHPQAGSDSSTSPRTDMRGTRLYLKAVRARTEGEQKIYCSPRIGLDLSHPGTTNSTTLPLHPRIRFLPRRYRFFLHPELLTANGRPQTFLGVLDSLVPPAETPSDELVARIKKPSLSKDIARIVGIKEGTSAKYLKDYVAGTEGGAVLLNEFIGTKGKGASSSPATYLKMMGAISMLNIS